MAEAGSTFGDLQAACVSDLGNRTDLDQDIYNACIEAIEKYQPKIFLADEAEAQWTTLAQNTNTAPLPPQFENMTSLYYNYTGTRWIRLTKVDQTKIEDDNVQTNPPLTGPPIEFSIYLDQLNFFPYADQNYALKAIYEELIPVPADDNTSNFWTVDAAAMIQHYAVGLVRQTKIRTGDMGQADFALALKEYNKLKGRVEDVEAPHRAKAVYL